MKPETTKTGYIACCLCKNRIRKGFLVSRLVAITFIPNTENKPYINHINGIKIDNKVENLEWCTQSENIKHAYKNGLKIPISINGSSNGNSKLTKEDVLKIRNLNNDGVIGSEISKTYSVTNSCVYSIINRRTWRHI